MTCLYNLATVGIKHKAGPHGLLAACEYSTTQREVAPGARNSSGACNATSDVATVECSCVVLCDSSLAIDKLCQSRSEDLNTSSTSARRDTTPAPKPDNKAHTNSITDTQSMAPTKMRVANSLK